MTKMNTWLSIVLLVQLGLAVSLSGFLWTQESNTAQQRLFEFDSASIDKIDIADQDDSVSVVKSSGDWHLSASDELQANRSKVSGILTKLANIHSSWPVATTSSSHNRFEVSDDNFQRRVSLYDGDELKAELFLGTSPGFRKVHMRLSGEEEIYTADLNTYDFPAEAEGWLDRTLLAVDDASEIQGPDFVLTKQDSDWQFAAKGPIKDAGSAELDTEKAEQLVSALSNLRVDKIAESIPDKAEKLEFTVSSDDVSHTYHFIASDDDYFVTREDMKTPFTISQYDYDKFAGMGYQDLAKQPIDETTDSNEEKKEENSD